MEHRFSAGELEGHAFGNLLIVAMAETGGDLVASLDEIGRLLGVVGRVLPATTDVRAAAGTCRPPARRWRARWRSALVTT